MNVINRCLLALFAMTIALPVHAQTTVRANWANLGKGDLEAVSNGTTLNVGPNAITISTRVVKSGDGNDPNFVPYYSGEMLSYYSQQIGSIADGVLLYDMEHSNFVQNDYFETTYSFASAARNLSFLITGLDYYGTFWQGYAQDGVTVEYSLTATGDNWSNANTFITRGSGINTTAGAVFGIPGFQGSAANGNSANGDLSVALANLDVRRIRIRYYYGNTLGAGTNPTAGLQYIGVGDFAWTQSGITVSDLELSGTVSNSAPAAGSNVTYTLSLFNRGPAAATSVKVRDLIPSGTTFLSATGSVSYDSATGLWTLPTIAANSTQTLAITVRVDLPAGTSATNIAEVWTSTNSDPDSVPANGLVEDDRAAMTLTVQGTRSAGIAPMLSCPAGSSLFDWDSKSWTAGSLSGTLAQANVGNVAITMTASSGWAAGFPALGNSQTGGLATAQNALIESMDFASRSDTVTTTIALPTAVPGAQFTIFDVDYGANGWSDQITVAGTYQGATVLPTLTTGTANYAVGNTAIGDVNAGPTSAAGNVTATFTSAVDTITITYGNASTAPSNPAGQVIAIHDITLCNPVAVLAVTKISTLLSDPVTGSTNPKAIPGALVEYCILISNPGSGTATGLTGSDTLPNTLSFVSGSMRSGTTCGTATIAEDDDAAGADETDPYGASITGNVLSLNTATLAPSASWALKYRASVK